MNHLTIFYIFVILQSVLSLSDVSEKVLGDHREGLISAFGDFTADKYTDVFVISSDGKSLLMYTAASDKQFTRVTLLNNNTIDPDVFITSVVPADFDGDLQMDILVTLRAKGDESYKVSPRIYWGQGSKLDTESVLVLPDMVDQPLLMDYNADMVPDLFGETSPGDRKFWIFSSERRNYTEEKQEIPAGQTSHSALRTPQSSSFIDLNNDLTADLCVVTKVGDITVLEIWINQEGKLKFTEKINVTYDKELKVIGQFVFADFDGDLITDIMVPACLDDDCTQSLILVYKNKKWIRIPIGFQQNGLTWNFIPVSKTGAPGFMRVPITLRVGDFNLDGFPDILAVLGNHTGNLHRAVLMLNRPCDGCTGFDRTFSIDWDTWLESHDTRALLPAFYDLYDNGILDVIISSIDSKGSSRIEVKEHDFVDDACFMKVTVVSGLCNYDCPNGKKPYGVNQPGPAVRYKTTNLRGNQEHKIAFQLSQSAYMSLQLPYSIFGLGQTPNFVDILEVGIPTNSSKKLSSDWTSVIPNSQLVVIPYPIQDPSSWSGKLFVMPSRLMMLTGAALLGTCGFIAGIVGILHWRDKIEDKKEKRQEAQKFHFDAM
ncbi:T-cell immunomodulatory protein [Mactra antiquata]